ncbi:hypothetical protein E3V39_14605 [Gammaproteobacteria bacterium LSUCC0112]|nr:hypothetical protein E3V39_14605 [Gammaproteobacteria bacterium LSUCC0112]
MTLLIVGLLVFLGIHSLNIVAPDQRLRLVNRLGAGPWKLSFSVISLIGLMLIIQGYSAARTQPVWIWLPPTGLSHLVILLTIPAFILLAAAYVPSNRIKAKLGHPMLAAVKIWAMSHLLANGSLADIIMFGSFLLWAIAGFAVLRRRDRMSGKSFPVGNLRADIVTISAGLLGWALFAMVLHTLLIGVSPLPF